MKEFLSRKVSLAWLVAALALAPALGIIYKLWILDAAPSGVVISAPVETLTEPVQAIVKTQSTPTSVPTASVRTTSTTIPMTSAVITPSSSLTELAGPAPSPTIAELIAYVSGEVVRPGVYHLPLDARVADLISAAGGMTAEANGDLLNLAQRLEDEEHVIVPPRGTTPVLALVQTPVRSPTRTRVPATPSRSPTSRTAETPPTVSPASHGKININTASEKELETLDGIGPSLAARIVAFRQANGPFAVPEDLMKVPGIKQGIFSKVRDSITVGP